MTKSLIAGFSGFVFLMFTLWWAFFDLDIHVWHRLFYPLFPLNERVDTLLALISSQSLAHFDWFPFLGIKSSSLGAPFGMDLREFPGGDNITTTLWAPLAWLSHNAFFTINSYFILTYCLTWFSFFLLCRHFRLHPIISSAMAILYSLLPYHFIRYHHIIQAAYFLIPFCVYTLLKLSKRNVVWHQFKPDSIKQFVSEPMVLCSALFGCYGVYHAFFYLYFLFIYGAFSSAFYRTKKHFLIALRLMAVTLIFLFIFLIPTLCNWHSYGKNRIPIARSKTEAEVFGLKLINLIEPTKGNRFVFLDKLQTHYPKLGIEGENESLGLMGGIGFFIMLYYGIRFSRRKTNTLHRLSLLLSSAFLLGTVGGVGDMISFFLFPLIRSYNRVSIFIATGSFLGLSILFQGLGRRLKWGRSFWLLFGTCFIVSLIDSTPTTMRFSDVGEKSYVNEHPFFERIQSLLPKGAMVLELPYVPFPEGAIDGMLNGYEELIPYLHTQTLRYSHGIIKGRKTATLIQSLSSDLLTSGTNTFLKIKELGYQGVYIFRKGYKDHGKKIENEFTQLTAELPIVSPNGENSFFVIQ